MGNVREVTQLASSLCVAVSVISCTRPIPDTARNEFEAERIEQACDKVEPGAHYTVRPTNVLLKEREPRTIGIGAFGQSHSFPPAHGPLARLGVYQNKKQQLTRLRSWDEAQT